jgi:2-methylcitrate dehydratase PrpD
MTASERLAAFAASLPWQTVPDTLYAKAKDHILDTLGVMCAGAAAPQSAALAKALVASQGAGRCSIVGTSRRLPPRDAAFANAFSGRIHTFDDTLESGPLHPGSSVIAAALATAQAAGASGCDLLRSVLAGYEVAARVSLGLGPTHYARGFHNTGTCNAFGAATAAACVRGLTAERITDALGIAGGMASGVRQYQLDGSMSDSALNGAHAALAGVLAADLAAAGLRGPAGILDGRFGVGALTSAGPDLDAMLTGLGRDFRFAATALKPYPSCRFTHGPIHEVARLRQLHCLLPERIVRIEITTFRQSIEVSDRPVFPTRSEALLSHQFAIAAAMIRGRFTLRELEASTIADPAIMALAKRVSVRHDAALEARYPQSWPHYIGVTIDDGRVLEAVSENPPGGADMPLPRSEVMAKFLENAAPSLGHGQALALSTAISGLESIRDVRALGGLLGPQPAFSVASAAAREPTQATE